MGSLAQHSTTSSVYERTGTASPSVNHIAPVAPEIVERVLGAISRSDGVFFNLADLVFYCTKHSLPFTDDILNSMFEEANNTGNGLMDSEQLLKAAAFKFPHRKHNHDWARLFELAPRARTGSARVTEATLASGGRVTALSPRPLEQEPIRANFEQEPQILTFSPLTNRAPGTGTAMSGTGGGWMTASAASYSSAPRTLSSSAIFNTAHSLPPKVNVPPNNVQDREEEEAINRRLQPDSFFSGALGKPGSPGAPAPTSMGTAQVASFDTYEPHNSPVKCTFDACAAYDLSQEKIDRVSRGHGWTDTGKGLVKQADAAKYKPPLLYGLHERDFLYVPAGPGDHIPLRVDGHVSSKQQHSTATAAQHLSPSLSLLSLFSDALLLLFLNRCATTARPPSTSAS